MIKPDVVIKKYNVVDGCRTAEITIQNDVFNKCIYNFNSMYSYGEWMFLLKVALRI